MMKPSLTLRRFSTGSIQLDRSLDEIYRALTFLVKLEKQVGVTQTIFNNGTGAVERGKLYGRDAAGCIAPALASTVAPIWLAESSAGAGQKFEVRIIGPSRVIIDLPSAPGISAAGALAWLSDSAPGMASATAPATTRFLVGRFAETFTGEDQRVGIDLFIFPQGGTTL